jgi:anthraniloyl-CoA monooxygenase
MKIAIIGAGPAGLYFALLMKKQFPTYHIELHERNSADDTFGWGVVFSDKTLNYLRQEDEPTYEEITRRFETWDNVEVAYRDDKLTIGGNKFSGIARIEILHVLQRRCEELGVEMHFKSNVLNVGVFRDYDLIVGADGINSEVRSEFAEHFKPDLSTRSNRYIWYGTPQIFNALTLTFRENTDGVFASHSYKFSKKLSTFIVECDEETWRNAKFESMDESQTRSYLERVFERDLGGHTLLSNNSKWINFVLVKNRHWWHDNIVLLGDSLATVHFSIGSGTKLALEDAIALFHAFRTTERVPDALIEFEAKRRPIVDEYQEAAYESLLFFEHLRDYVHLDPLPFAYRLMTRSKRIDHENLRKRDPRFIEAYENYSRELT